MDPKDAYIYIGLAASTTMLLAIFVSFQTKIIYEEIGVTETNVGQLNVDLLRGKDAIQEYYRRERLQREGLPIDL